MPVNWDDFAPVEEPQQPSVDWGQFRPADVAPEYSVSPVERRRGELAQQMEQVHNSDGFSRWLANTTVSPRGTGRAAAQAGVTGVGAALQGLAGAVELYGENARNFDSETGLPTARGWRVINDEEKAPTPAETVANIRSDPVYKYGQQLRDVAPEVYPVSEQEKKSILVQGAGAAGSFLPLLATGPAAPLTIALQSAGEHLGPDYDEAIAKGATPDEAAKTALGKSIASGAIQGIIFSALPAPLRKLGDKFIIDQFGGTLVKNLIASRVAQAGEGAAIGAASAVGENVASEKPLTENLGPAAIGMAAIQAATPRGRNPNERPSTPIPESQPQIVPSAENIPRPPEDVQRGQGTLSLKTETPVDAQATEQQIREATNRALAAVADRKPVSGQDVRYAGARDRMADLGYAFDEANDVYNPVRQTGNAAAKPIIPRNVDVVTETVTPQPAPNLAQESVATPEVGGKTVGMETTAKPPELQTPQEFYDANASLASKSGMARGLPETQLKLIDQAVGLKKPLLASTLSDFKVDVSKLPEGYVREGDLYVYREPTPERPTPITNAAGRLEQLKSFTDLTPEETAERNALQAKSDAVKSQMQAQLEALRKQASTTESISAAQMTPAERATSEGQKKMASEAASVATVTMLNKRVREKAPDKAWDDKQIQAATGNQSMLNSIRDDLLPIYNELYKKEPTKGVESKPPEQPPPEIALGLNRPAIQDPSLRQLSDAEFDAEFRKAKSAVDAEEKKIDLVGDIDQLSASERQKIAEAQDKWTAASLERYRRNNLDVVPEDLLFELRKQADLTDKQNPQGSESFERFKIIASELARQGSSVSEAAKGMRDYPERLLNNHDFIESLRGQAQDIKALLESAAKENPPARQALPEPTNKESLRVEPPAQPIKFQVGNSPQTYTLVERMKPTEIESANSEQPMRIRNDKTGAEQVVMESDLTQVGTAPKKPRTKRDLNAELEAAGLDPSVFKTNIQKRNALERLISKVEGLQEKIQGSRSSVNLGVPSQVALIALEQARLVLLATKSLAAAINKAVEVAKAELAKLKDAPPFDENEFRAHINRELTSETRKRVNAQIQGAPIGNERDVENIAQTQEVIRDRYFDSRKPVSDEQTAAANALLDRLTRMETKNWGAGEIQAVTNSQMAPGLTISELWRYAEKQVRETGDDRLMRRLVSEYNDVATPPTQSGRELRALQETDTALSRLVAVEQAAREAIGKKLGVGKDLLDRLINRLKGVEPTPEEVAVEANKKSTTPKSPKEAEVEAAKEVKSSAEQTAKDYLDKLQQEQTEWLKPGGNKNAVLEIIRKFLRSEAPFVIAKGEHKGEPLPFSENPEGVTLLRSELERVGVTPETARQIGFDLNQKRNNLWSQARERQVRTALNPESIRGITEAIRSTPYARQQDPNWRLQVATDWLMARGLSREQAESVAATYQEAFNAAYGLAQERLARQLLAGATPRTTEDVVRAIRAGLADPSKPWFDQYAEKAGWKPATTEDFKRLSELDEKLSDPSLSPPEVANLNEQIAKVIRGIGPTNPPGTLLRRLNELTVGNLLSGIRTATVQFGPIITAARDLPHMILTDPKNAKNIITAMYNATKEVFLSELKYAWQKNAYGYHLQAIDREHNELLRWWENLDREYKKAGPAGKAAITLKRLYAGVFVVSRALSSVDQAMMATNRDWKLAYYAQNAFKEAGLSTSKISDLIDAMTLARQSEFENAIAAGLDPNTAKVRANYRVGEAVKDFVENNANGDNRLAHDALRAAENDIYSIVGRHAEGLKETDEGLLSSWFTPWMEALSQIRSKGGAPSLAAVQLLGFVNVPFRTARFLSSYSPYGLLRYGIYKYRQNRGLDNYWKQSFGNALQARARLYEAVAGTAAFAGAAAIAQGFKTSDDNAGNDKFGIYFTGRGPKNKNLNDAWQKEGWRPYSATVVINGHKINFPITRVGEAVMWPAAVGAITDDYYWAQKEAQLSKKPFQGASAALGTTIGTLAYMMGQKGLLQGPQQLAQVISGSGGFEKALIKLGSGAVSSIALPFKQALASLSNLIEGPLDQSSATSIVANNFPIVGLPWQKRAVNRFGDQLYDNSWYGKIANTGIPFAFQVDKNPTNSRIYPMLADKGAAPPELRRYVLEEKYGELSDNQFAEFSRKSGNLLKREVESNVAALEKATPEQVRAFMQSAAQQADRIAANSMGLQRAQPLSPRATAPAASTPSRARQPRYVTGRLRSRVGRSRLGRTRVRSYVSRPRSYRNRISA